MIRCSVNLRRVRRLPPRRVAVKDWGDTLVIRKGLEVAVHGCLIDLDRNEESHVAYVRVTPLGDATVAQVADVKEAADLLATRAQRLLGHDWTVVRWTLPKGAAGQYTAGSGV